MEIAATLVQTREPLLITQNGEARMVLVDVETYEQQEQTIALLKMLAMGNREIELGKYRDAKEVFAGMDSDT